MAWLASDPIRIVVPGPPKALERNRHRIVKKRDGSQFVANYLPAKSRAEQSSIRKFAWEAMGNKQPIDGAADLRVVAYMPVPASWSSKKRASALADRILPTGRPDFDNIVKNVCDAFKEIVWRDDTLVTDAAVFLRYSTMPRLVIEVRQLTWTA
jgi:Holliday junction resolvase RusA-like endonuclease